MTEGHQSWVRGVGLLVGLGLTVAAVATWRVPHATGHLGSDVVIATEPTGELGISPAGPLVTANGLMPGEETAAPSGAIQVRNRTGSTLFVQLRGLPSAADLDRLLWVGIDADGSRIFRGPLGDLRSWTEEALTLVPGEHTDLSVRTWLPSSVASGYQGRIETVSLEFRTIPAES